MPRNAAAAPGHVCPGIRTHIIDIVHPPDIGISRMADMDAHLTIVTAALAAKSSAVAPKKTHCLCASSHDGCLSHRAWVNAELVVRSIFDWAR
jgi:hypothetical protein